MRDFFIVVPPGLEEELIAELREVGPFLIGADGRPDLAGFGEVEIARGGVRLRAEPLAALQLHFWLKTASRILLRLESFRSTEFFQLEKNLKRYETRKGVVETLFDTGHPMGNKDQHQGARNYLPASQQQCLLDVEVDTNPLGQPIEPSVH